MGTVERLRNSYSAVAKSLALTLAFALTLPLSGCSRGRSPGSSSSITISIPKSFGSQKAIPINRTPCYGINVHGAGVDLVTGNTCSPPTGLVAGYTLAGTNLEVSVPRNLVVDIDLYMYLLPPGSGSVCPKLVPAILNSDLGNTFIVGNSKDVSTNADTVSVDIVATFPGLDQNITQQLAMPTECKLAALPPGGPPNPFSMSLSDQVATSAVMSLHGHVGSVVPHNVLSGLGIKLIVR